MANMASNRSSSPFSTRNSRNSESNSTIRRSFSGNPSARPTALTNPRSFIPPTPANSPATTDYTKRHSVGREGVCNSRFQEEKENDKAAKVKCSRNFMAPTISAASKFTPSPRKKVLGERNELTRTSIQFSDIDNKAMEDSDMNPEKTPLAHTKMEEVSHDLTNVVQKEVVFEAPLVHEVILNSNNDSSEVLSEVTENSSCSNVVESSSKISPFCYSSPMSPNTTPINADVSLPPYDPKKNFLSPRPRFLHYKPNPRIEVFLNNEKRCEDFGEGVNRLEDSLDLSQSSSDTNVTEEEEETQSGDSVKESLEDLSDTASEEQQSEVPISTPMPDQEVKKVSKARFFTPSKTVPFLLVLFLVACFSISFTDSQPMDLPIYKDLSFSNLYHEANKFAAFAKESFDGFAKSFKQWLTNLVSCLSHLKSHFSATDYKISSIRFSNLTTAPPPKEEFLFDGYIGTNFLDGKKSEQRQEFDWREIEEEMEEESETLEAEDYQDLEVDDDNIEEEAGDVETAEEAEEIQSDEQIQSGDSLQIDFNGEDGLNEISHIPVSESEVKPEIEVSGIEPEVESEMVVSDLDTAIDSSVADINVEASSETIFQSEPLDSLLTRSVNLFSNQNMLPILTIFSLVVATLVVIHMKKGKSVAENTSVRVAEPLAMTKRQIFNQEAREEGDDVTEESCPSEMSSSYNNSKRTGPSEAQSQERKPKKKNKRESLATYSSDFSMGSPSYGSFTTYERIPIKHGDDEVVTPIRRSSRLMKNQVTSS